MNIKNMSYYKVKVRHKRYEDIRKSFYLEAISPAHAIEQFKITAAQKDLSYYVLPQTICEISFGEYETGLLSHGNYL